MKAIARNWKAVLAFLLMLAALLVYFMGYKPKKTAYEQERNQLNMQITALQTTIAENERYKDVKDLLPAELEKIDASRDGLYEVFPQEIREEDQILYLLYLEQVFGGEFAELGFTQNLYENRYLLEWNPSRTQGLLREYEDQSRITFEFGQVQPIQVLSDGAVLQALDINLTYDASYDGFKKMVHYLATDSRVTSIRFATFNYNVLDETLSGQLALRLYLLDATDREYAKPDITNPGTGKPNMFDD